MRLRFWEPPVPPPYVYSSAAGLNINLPPRRLNLTELDHFGRAMAQALGSPETSYEVIRHETGEANTGVEVPTQLEELVRLLPTQRSRVWLRAKGPEHVLPDGSSAGGRPELVLSLGDGQRVAAQLLEADVPGVRQLPDLWAQLGRARRTWAWLYPTGFLLALAGALAPLIVMWARGRLSFWLIAPVAGLVVMAFAVFAPILQGRVKAHREARAGLDIDFRLLETVRTDRAVHRRNLQSGLLGALLGAIATGAGVWATLQAAED
jgi:hypothetical protein